MNPSLQFCQQPIHYERVEEMYPDFGLPMNFPLAGWEFSIDPNLSNQYGYQCNPGLFPMADTSYMAMDLSTVPSAMPPAVAPVEPSAEESNMIQQFILMEPVESCSSTPPLEHTNPKVAIKRLPQTKPNKPQRTSPKPRNVEACKYRTPHVVVEKKYRDSLILGIESLRREIVESNQADLPKLNKATVLRKATEYIRQLKQQNQALKQENDMLRLGLISLSGGPELLHQFNTKGTMVATPPSRFFMLSAGLLLTLLFTSLSSHPLFTKHSKDNTLALSALPAYFLMACLLLFCSNDAFNNFTKWVFNTGSVKLPKDKLTSELLVIDELSINSSILNMLYNIIKLSVTVTYQFLLYRNPPYQHFNAAFQAHITRHTQLTLQVYLTYKDKYLARFLRKLVLLLINIKYYLLVNDKDLLNQLNLSGSLITLSISSSDRLVVTLVRQLINRIDSNLIQSNDFLRWVVNLPTTFQQHLSATKEVSSLDLVTWVTNQFYLDQLHSQFMSYILNPQVPPKSLAPVLQIMMLDPVIKPGSPSLLNVIYLEAALALTCQPDYALILTKLLIKHYLSYPHLHPTSHYDLLRGLLGCCLALPTPHQSLPTAYYLLSNYLTPNLKLNTPTHFLITHIIFTYAINHSKPNRLTKDPYHLPQRYLTTQHAYQSKLNYTLKKLQAYLMITHPNLDLDRRAKTVWLNYYYHLTSKNN